MGKQVVDPAQEIPGHCFDPVQRMSKVLFALPGLKNKQTNPFICIILIFSVALTEQTETQTVPGVGGELLLQHGVLLAQGDASQLVCVSIFEGVVSLLAQVLNCLGEVCLNEIYQSFLLGVEALQCFHFTWRVQGKTVLSQEN